MSNLIRKNSFYNVIKIFSTMLYPLVTFPYVTRVLGVENVGKLSFSESIVNYVLLIASLGIPSYAVRECAKVNKDKKQLSLIASQLWSINILSTIFAYLVFGIILFSSRIFQSYQLLICIQLISVILTTLGADWLNTAMEDLKYVALRTLFFQILAVVCMFIFVKNENDYLIYAVITLISSSAGNLVNIFYRRKYCSVKFTLEIHLHKHIIPILLMFSILISQVIYTNSDITLLKIFTNEYDVGIYSVSVKIYNVLNMFISSVFTVILPQLSFQYKNNNYQEIKSVIIFGFRFIVILGLPCIVCVNILTRELITFIAGTNYLLGSMSLHILSIALIFSLIGGLFGGLLLASGREKVGLWASITGATINLLLNFLFIPKFGSTAASITTMISEFIAMIIVLTNLEREIQFKNEFFSILIKPFVATLFIGIFAYVFKSFIIFTTLKFACFILFEIVMYFVILFLLNETFIVNLLKSVKIKLMNFRGGNEKN